jgi:hypothetical protein
MRRFFGVVVVCAAGLTGCVSPESTRTRGGGPGADSQNRPANVKMHEGSRPFWETPLVIDDEYPELESAQQARQLSVP